VSSSSIDADAAWDKIRDRVLNSADLAA